MNQIHVIKPYRSDYGLWLFDDKAVGLEREPFVSDMSEIIDKLTVDIPEAAKGFIALFSSENFRGAHIVFALIDGDLGGATYRCINTNTDGWLCPALFRYFETPPKRIFAQFLPRGRAINHKIKTTNNHEKTTANISRARRRGAELNV